MQSIQATQPLTAGYKKRVYTGRLRKTLLRLVLILVGVGAGLGVAEIIMRAFQLGHTRKVVLYNDKIFKLPPHVSFMNNDENKNLVETNNLGFHDRERQAANDNYRILVLGDSFVEGRQVDTESLFTRRLEKKFSAGGQKIEVINGGVPSTGTAYQYSLWKEFFEPSMKVNHLVLCFFMGNDLVDNNQDLSLSNGGESDNTFFVDSQGNILGTRKKPDLFKQTINYGRDHSVLMDSLYESAYRIRKSLHGESGANGGDEGGRVDRSGAWQASEQGTIALLKRWRSELAGQSIPFDVVVIDRPGKIYNKFELEFSDRLQTACAEDHIACLRLKLTDDPFESYSFDGINLGHFNYQGHELAANELYDYFKSHHAAIFNARQATGN